MTRRFVAGLAVAALAVTACAPGVPVDVEESHASRGPLAPDGQARRPDVVDDAGGDGDVDGDDDSERPATSIAWGSCDEFEIPDRVLAATSGWECGTLVVAMDPFGHDGDDGLAAVELALTRHRATGDRLGAIVVNPGGPGAGGVPTAWGTRPGMPTELLRGFDIVGFDPRGVGRSIPPISCGDAESFEVDFIAECVAETGALSSYLSAPYVAADLEAIRVALGEDELHYLGYSYGSILGATYADRHPETTGRFVLDGVTDPLAGSADGPFDDGFATFADDGRPAALDRLAELCDATVRCLPERDAGAVIDGLTIAASGLPTDDFAGEPQRLDSLSIDEFLDVAVAFAADWELVATALLDADRGDGSAIAAMLSDEAPDEPDAPGTTDRFDNFAAANFMIYCADFGPLITRWSFCDAMPVNDEPLQPVQRVELDTPMLIIGTEYDPLTPGTHAPEFADALGDASYMIWDGVGHTAFPGWTDCIDDAVAGQFVDGVRPPDGTRCSMVEGITDDATLADELFGFDRIEAENWLADRFEDAGTSSDEARCLSAEVVGPLAPEALDDMVVSHLILEVTSDRANAALAGARARC